MKSQTIIFFHEEKFKSLYYKSFRICMVFVKNNKKKLAKIFYINNNNT